MNSGSREFTNCVDDIGSASSCTTNSSKATVVRSIAEMAANSPRKSSRLSSVPHQSNGRLNYSTIHRTLSGGVSSSHSPKLGSRKRDGVNETNDSASYANTRSHVTFQGDTSVHTENGESELRRGNLPMDQSDDEENFANNCATGTVEPIKLATRSQVLFYFTLEVDGYRCKLCQRVNSIAFFYRCHIDQLCWFNIEEI